VRDRRHAGDILLALDPDVDRLHVGAGRDVVLGLDGLLNPVNLCDDIVLARVAGQDLAAVFKLVLGISAAPQADGCDDAVRHGACAGVDVHCVQGDGGAVVGGEADELRRSISKRCCRYSPWFGRRWEVDLPLTLQSQHLGLGCRCQCERAPF
jgi:hypothetical protein